MASAKYGPAHRRRRKQLLAMMRDGQPCARCGRPMFRSADNRHIELDHLDDGGIDGGGTALSHRTCNRRAGRLKAAALAQQRKEAAAQQQPSASVPRTRACEDVHTGELPARPPWDGDGVRAGCCGGYLTGRVWLGGLRIGRLSSVALCLTATDRNATMIMNPPAVGFRALTIRRR